MDLSVFDLFNFLDQLILLPEENSVFVAPQFTALTEVFQITFLFLFLWAVIAEFIFYQFSLFFMFHLLFRYFGPKTGFSFFILPLYLLTKHEILHVALPVPIPLK